MKNYDPPLSDSREYIMRVLGQTAMIFNIFVSKENRDLADSLYQLIHSQPLNPKNLESSFPPNYSPFPIPTGIKNKNIIYRKTLKNNLYI